MPMDQDRINQNFNNSISILNKAIINILARQTAIINILAKETDVFSKEQHTTLLDLIELDNAILKKLQENIDRMKTVL